MTIAAANTEIAYVADGASVAYSLACEVQLAGDFVATLDTRHPRTQIGVLPQGFVANRLTHARELDTALQRFVIEQCQLAESTRCAGG